MSVSDETIAKLQKLNTPTLANALEECGIEGVITGLAPAGPGLRCVGRAVTVLEMTGPRGAFPAGDFKVGEMIDAAGPGDVVVVSNGGAPISTWGGTASYAAHLKGIAGLVVDGGIRDREEICEIGFPAFARHMIPTTGKTRIRVEAIGVPVTCSGIRVDPGDVVVADGTGVVCIPAARAAEVADLATRYAADDARAMEELRGGLTFREAMAKFAKI
jgi:regulator of RNase E activity RraA